MALINIPQNARKEDKLSSLQAEADDKLAAALNSIPPSIRALSIQSAGIIDDTLIRSQNVLNF